VQDQLAGLAGTATQLDPCAGREGLGGKAQAERQGLVAAAQVAAGQQALRATALIDHQQRQFDVGAGRHAFQGAAQFALVGGQGAEIGRLLVFFTACCCELEGAAGFGASLLQATSRLTRLSKTSGLSGI